LTLAPTPWPLLASQARSAPLPAWTWTGCATPWKPCARKTEDKGPAAFSAAEGWADRAVLGVALVVAGLAAAVGSVAADATTFAASIPASRTVQSSGWAATPLSTRSL